MARQEGLDRSTILNQEEPFEDHEMFFSRTDLHGRILAGNEVFQRVSGYDWSTLIGAPHKIIRHPDMPRAVFYLLWREITAGRPVGAYVKNRSSQGAFYWVFAIVTPTPDGYLSVRIKPQGELLDRVEAFYEHLRARERAENLDPTESAAALEASLLELGFLSYQAFMSRALIEELNGRDHRLGRSREPRSRRLDELGLAASRLVTEVQAIDRAYDICRYMPMNLQIQAVRLGQKGAAVETVSTNYALIVAELAGHLETFTQAAMAVERAVHEALFLLSTARIQSEILQVFTQERVGPDAPELALEDIAPLRDQRAVYDAKALESVHAVARQAEQFQHACMEMKRLAAGLEVTRIIGKVESARLLETSEALSGLLNELGQFQRTIADGLGRLDVCRREISDNAGLVLKHSRAGQTVLA